MVAQLLFNGRVLCDDYVSFFLPHTREVNVIIRSRNWTKKTILHQF